MKTVIGMGILLSATMLLPGCQDSCKDVPIAAVNYYDMNNWLCRPGADDACSQTRSIYNVNKDGSVTHIDEGIAKNPPVDCFYIYPTVDYAVNLGVHEDVSDRAAAIDAVRTQAARFGEICSLYVPVYRQATFGTYAKGRVPQKPCFEVVYSDIHMAFRHYLENDNKGRGIILVGHGQGGQMIARLVRQRFDLYPELAKQLIVAMPIGWPLSTDPDSTVGASYVNIPKCTSADETACVIAFRSYFAGYKMPIVDDDYREGLEIVCSNPASPDAPNALRRLKDFTINTDSHLFKNHPEGVPAESNSWVRYADIHEARCVDLGIDGVTGLEVKWAPTSDDTRLELIDTKKPLISLKYGAIALDIALSQGDLIADAKRRTQVWLQANATPEP